MNTIRRRQLLKLAACCPVLGMPDAWSQSSWPDKAIRMVVGYPPGQSADIAARNFAAVMDKDLGQAIFVDNRAGANGILGAQEVKQSRPDGYTVLFGTSGQLSINPALQRKLPFDPLKDFAPVGMVLSGGLFLVAHPSFPPNNVQELIAYARTRPGKIDYGSGGIGVTAHLAMELLQIRTGMQLNHIPYNGSPAGLNSLMGGQISLMMDSGAATLPHVKSGRLKVLAYSAARRAQAFPNVPTVAEQGLKDFDVTGWNGMLVPAGTPAAIIDRLNASIRKASAEPLVLDGLLAAGAEAVTSTPAEFGAFLKAEVAKWREVVAKAGIQIA